MPMNRRNTRFVHRTTFAGIAIETVTLLKRGDNQRQGTVRSVRLYRCRIGRESVTGETIQRDMNVGNRATWHVPRIELDRVGVAYLNPADRIVDRQGRYWQPESTTVIESKLFQNEVDVQCLRVDPPAAG